MKLYLAGPMTGIEQENRPLFNRAAAGLREAGYEVLNPADLDNLGDNLPWEQCLRRDIPHLLSCDAVALLPGWQMSRGAKLEVLIASRLGMEIYVAEYRCFDTCCGWTLDDASVSTSALIQTGYISQALSL